MVATADIALLDFALGSVAALGLCYLLYAETLVVHYERFFRLITAGLLVYALTGPVIGTVAPAYIHLIHAAAGLCITVGLWTLVNEDRAENFEAVLAPDLGERRDERVDAAVDPDD